MDAIFAAVDAQLSSTPRDSIRIPFMITTHHNSAADDEMFQLRELYTYIFFYEIGLEADGIVAIIGM